MPRLKKDQKPKTAGQEVLEIDVEEDVLDTSAQEMLAEGAPETVETEEQDSVTLLKQKIEQMPLEDDASLVNGKVDDAQDLEDEEKIQYVLKLARTKGVIFAIKVAQKMDNPYILDSVHDALIEEGYYKKFE